MPDRPNALAADSHSCLLLANCIPLETQDPDDTFVYGARVYNSQYQLHTSPIEHMNYLRILHVVSLTYQYKCMHLSSSLLVLNNQHYLHS